MRIFRYSRWDGSQDEFTLDVDSVLDAMTELMMEGLDAREALEWMRQHGFEMAGMNMRVMGVQELMQELRDQAQALRDQYRMDHAMDEMQQRLDEILEREEAAQREAHAMESKALNDFLQKRHAEHDKLADKVEEFRDHAFADEQAGEEFRELLEELDRMRALEEFLEQQGQQFRGPESADYETAQEVREQIQALEQMAEDLANGNFEQLTPEQLQDMLGENAAQSFILLRDMESELRDAGYLRENDQLTPRAIRKIGAAALADVYNALRKGLAGDHDEVSRGVALPRPDESKPWEFGDPMNLDVVKTVMNGIKRGGASAEGQGVRLEVEDFEIREMDYSTQTTTILLLDMSWSMSWAGRFPAAKRVALAMDQLIRTRFPRDEFHVVGFSTRAREIPIRELPEVCWDMGDPFTNLQEGLMVAEQLIRRNPSSTPQILVITDGQPTAYFEPQPSGGKQLRVEWPSGFGGVSPHAVAETISQVQRITKMGVTINTFMLDDSPELVGFIERVTQINKGRAFYTHPSRLGSFLMVDYISRRKLRRG